MIHRNCQDLSQAAHAQYTGSENHHEHANNWVLKASTERAFQHLLLLNQHLLMPVTPGKSQRGDRLEPLPGAYAK